MRGSVFPGASRASSDLRVFYRDAAASRVLAKVTGNTTDQVGNPARLMRVQVREVPPVAEYDQWLATVKSSDCRAKLTVTGAMLRRSVVMMRSGSAVSDVCRALGKPALRNWIKRLPDHLAA